MSPDLWSAAKTDVSAAYCETGRVESLGCLVKVFGGGRSPVAAFGPTVVGGSIRVKRHIIYTFAYLYFYTYSAYPCVRT